MGDIISYRTALGLHLLAVALFLSGILVVSVTMPSLSKQAPSRSTRAIVRRLSAWNSIVTTPALLAVWTFGLTLAAEGGWFPATWLRVKIALVVVVSIVHIVQTRRLVRLGKPGLPASRQGFMPVVLILAAVAMIVLLVAVKPW